MRVSTKVKSLVIDSHSSRVHQTMEGQDAAPVAEHSAVEEDGEKEPPLGGEGRGEDEEEGESEEEEEGGGEQEERGPSDVIKVRVLTYNKTEDDYFYNIEVGMSYSSSHYGNNDIVIQRLSLTMGSPSYYTADTRRSDGCTVCWQPASISVETL